MYQHRHCKHSSTARKHPAEIERIEGGQDVDQGSSFLQIPWQGKAPTAGCRSCAILRSVARQSPEETTFVVESANDGAVVLRGSQLAGLVVVPRGCASSLQDLPLVDRGQVLAAIRIATLVVRDENASASRIEVMRDSSGLTGHVSYQVTADSSDLPTESLRQRSKSAPQLTHPGTQITPH
jgi:hypothetical protein